MTTLWVVVAGDAVPRSEPDPALNETVVSRFEVNGRLDPVPTGTFDAVLVDAQVAGAATWAAMVTIAAGKLNPQGGVWIALDSGLTVDDIRDASFLEAIAGLDFSGVLTSRGRVCAVLSPVDDATDDAAAALSGALTASLELHTPVTHERPGLGDAGRGDAELQHQRLSGSWRGAGFLAGVAAVAALTIWTELRLVEAVVLIMLLLTVLVAWSARGWIKRASTELRSADKRIRTVRRTADSAVLRIDEVRQEVGNVVAGLQRQQADARSLHDAVDIVGRRIAELEQHLTPLAQRVDDVVATIRTEGDSLLAAMHEESRAEVEAVAKQVADTSLDNVRRIRQVVVNESKELYRQLQAAENLFAMVPIEARIPAMRGWAASPDVLAYLVETLRIEGPRLVVECGSGVSTLWMALAIKSTKLDARVVALEHEAEYAEQTRELLRRHGVDAHAEVRDAPLEDAGIEGHETPWYSTRVLADLEGIGLLFVDGPPEPTGPMARLPALHHLASRLAPAASVIVDDTIREDEQGLVAAWQQRYPEFAVRRLPMEKGAVHLHRGHKVA